jgi:hypothetical protein
LTRFCGRGTVVETFRASWGNGSSSGSLTLFFNVFDIVEIGMFANIRQHRLAQTHLIQVKLNLSQFGTNSILGGGILDDSL